VLVAPLSVAPPYISQGLLYFLTVYNCFFLLVD